MANQTIFSTKIDKEMYNAFKGQCGAIGIKPNTIVLAFIRGFVNNEFELRFDENNSIVVKSKDISDK